MAIGTQSNFVIYEDEFWGGAYETIEQNVDAFNAASNNCVRLLGDVHRGDFQRISFFQNVSGLVARRDPTATGAVISAALTMDDATAPKLSRRIGPVEDTISAFKKIGQTPEIMSFIIGQQAGRAMLQDHLDSGVMACEAALDGVAALEVDQSGTTITTDMLVQALAKFGDAAGRVRLWVMHSKVFWNLVSSQITDKITNIADVNIATAMPITLGRPVLVTDCASLIEAGTTTTYVTLGLTEGAIEVNESEERTLLTEPVTGLENITYRIQGEYGITVRVKGFDFTGSANPNDAALGSSANWAQVAGDVKSCAGVRLITQ